MFLISKSKISWKLEGVSYKLFLINHTACSVVALLGSDCVELPSPAGSSPAAQRTPISGRRRSLSAARISSLSSLSSLSSRTTATARPGDLMEVKIGGLWHPMGATEMYWQGSGLVESIDGPFAANDSPIVATARLSAKSLLLVRHQATIPHFKRIPRAFI